MKKILANIKNIGIIALIVIIGLLLMKNCNSNNKIEKQKKNIEDKDNFLRVINDSMKTYKDKNGDLISEKNSFQSKISTLEENNKVLSENQKNLLKEIEHNKNIIAASQSKIVVRVDTLYDNNKAEIINDTTIIFVDSTKNIKYEIRISGIVPKNPKLEIIDLELPNDQTVTHEWDSTGHVIVKIKNSNPYFSVNDIDGYVIPEATKDNIKDIKKKKLKNTIRDAKNIIIGVGVGLIVASLFIIL